MVSLRSLRRFRVVPSLLSWSSLENANEPVIATSSCRTKSYKVRTLAYADPPCPRVCSTHVRYVEQLCRPLLGLLRSAVVPGGGGHAGVPGELLHGDDISSLVQEIRDEGSAEVVGREALRLARPELPCLFVDGTPGQEAAMPAFGEEWRKRYHRPWWRNIIEAPLDLLAFLHEMSSEDYPLIGKYLDERLDEKWRFKKPAGEESDEPRS